jgi:hypothetical protein
MGTGNSWLEKFLFYFGVLMVAVYVGFGTALLFFPVFTYIDPPYIKKIFGLFFVLYGLFRLVRIWQKFKGFDS